MEKHIIDQNDILKVLVLGKKWMPIKEVIQTLGLDYDLVTRVKIQRKLVQLQKFGFIISKVNKNSQPGRAPYMFKSKRQI